MSNQSFSQRQGFKSQEKEITIRYEAPEGLRAYIVQTIDALGYEPEFSRKIVCRVLRKTPDKNNWSPYPNIYNEIVELLNESDWFYVYDVIEALYKETKTKDKQPFETEINEFFFMNGIGWKLTNGSIEVRGEAQFELELESAISILEEAKLPTAKAEIKEALADLSRRPEPDVTGAVQHSLACLECVAREVAGNSKMTLGELIKKHSHIVPKPLDEAVYKIWGYTSEQGRHLREGGQPDFDEAELIVGLSAVLSTYLAKKFKNSNKVDDSH